MTAIATVPQTGVHVRDCAYCNETFNTRHMGQFFCSVKCNKAAAITKTTTK